MKKPNMGKHVGNNHPRMFKVPDKVTGDKQVTDCRMKHFPGLIQETGADVYNQLKQDNDQEHSHIDYDQPGYSITRLKLISDIVCYGFKHVIKVGLFGDNIQRP